MEKFLDDVSKEKLVSNFHMVIADAEELLSATANQSGEKLDEIRSKVRESIQVMKNSIQHTEMELLMKTRAAAKATDAYVHQNPWESVGAAATFGLVLGWLIARR